MKIDLPVTIIFDCQNTDWPSIKRAAAVSVCTVRFDTDNPEEPAQLFDHYPPRKDAAADPGDAVLTPLTVDTFNKIRRRAEANPYDYLSDKFSEEEWQAAQDKVDSEREPSE